MGLGGDEGPQRSPISNPVIQQTHWVDTLGNSGIKARPTPVLLSPQRNRDNGCIPR